MAHKPYAIKTGAPAEKRNSAVPLYLLGGAVVLIIIGVFVLLRGSSGPAKAIEVAGKPKLAVDGDRVDLGKVPLGKPVTVEFELSNVGGKPLELQGIPKVEVREGC